MRIMLGLAALSGGIAVPPLTAVALMAGFHTLTEVTSCQPDPDPTVIDVCGRDRVSEAAAAFRRGRLHRAANTHRRDAERSDGVCKDVRTNRLTRLDRAQNDRWSHRPRSERRQLSLAGVAPRAGFEPATFRLTVERSTAELPGNTAAEGARITTHDGFASRRTYVANCSITMRSSRACSGSNRSFSV